MLLFTTQQKHGQWVEMPGMLSLIYHQLSTVCWWTMSILAYLKAYFLESTCIYHKQQYDKSGTIHIKNKYWTSKHGMLNMTNQCRTFSLSMAVLSKAVCSLRASVSRVWVSSAVPHARVQASTARSRLDSRKVLLSWIWSNMFFSQTMALAGQFITTVGYLNYLPCSLSFCVLHKLK